MKKLEYGAHKWRSLKTLKTILKTTVKTMETIEEFKKNQ